MESASASISIHLQVLFLLLIIHILAMSSSNADGIIATAHTKPQRLVMKLIHRDSISMARYAHVTAKTSSSSNTAASDIDVQAGAIPDILGRAFLVNLSIGQPPVPQLLVMDTGSSLLWVQCLPCTKCFKQWSPMFNPSRSSTYRSLQCTSPYCLFDPLPCGFLGACQYEEKYVGKATTRGILGMDELTFMTSDQGTVSIPQTVFGCGGENEGLGGGLLSGVLGLGWHNASLVYRIGSKFSYCIGNLDDPEYEYNQLIIGDGAKIEGYSTSMEVYNHKYYLTLEGISVGEKRLDINPEIFRRGQWGDGGVLIDSGTTITYLHKGAYEPLRAEVETLIGGLLERVTHPKRPDCLCYKGWVRQDLQGFPVMTFHFAGGADLVLDVDALFAPSRYGTFCMLVVQATAVQPDSSGLTIIGIRAQQYYNVGHDLDAMKLYFQRIDCDLLED